MAMRSIEFWGKIPVSTKIASIMTFLSSISHLIPKKDNGQPTIVINYDEINKIIKKAQTYANFIKKYHDKFPQLENLRLYTGTKEYGDYYYYYDITNGIAKVGQLISTPTPPPPLAPISPTLASVSVPPTPTPKSKMPKTPTHSSDLPKGETIIIAIPKNSLKRP